MTTPLISAAICTYNRSAYLGAAIESVARQTLDPDLYEVVIVDNNSTDATKQVVDSAVSQHADVHIRYVTESVQGLSAARNRASAEARGQYIAYLDDDAHAEPAWLSATLNAFQNLKPAPACVGGRIYPDWEGGIPGWVPTQFLSLYSFLDHGDKPLCLNDQPDRSYLNGANIAFRKALIAGGYAFSNALGRRGTNLLSGEETEVIHKLIADGYWVYYVPNSIVWHTVLPDRQKRSYLIRRVFAEGATQVVLDMRQQRLPRDRLTRRVLYDGRLAIYWLLRSTGSLLLNRKAEAFQFFLYCLRKTGRTHTELKTILNR
jgi:glycosyltransferase involved in cell wall biosynthesis